jgi:hypothetical protein
LWSVAGWILLRFTFAAYHGGMERLERFYKIDHLLKDRKVVSFSSLQSSLGVSRATLKRDLDYMRDRFNAPIEYDREANGYASADHAPGRASVAFEGFMDVRRRAPEPLRGPAHLPLRRV